MLTAPARPTAGSCPAGRWRREVEESIYFAGLGGPRRSRQIVLSFKASDIPEVHWQLTPHAYATPAT